MLFEKGLQPFVHRTGEIYFVDDNFRKRNVLIRKMTGSGQFRDVLDMSSDNPDYKEALEKYSVINRTGISAVMDRMSDPKVSPNGKFLSVTIFGYPQQAFDSNCVAIFDLSNGKLIKKFTQKYYGSWTADNRLVLSGAYKSVSTDGNMYPAQTPGIFITDAAFQTMTRLDDGLDDPSPYHATVSPDGKRIAFILNNHVWTMDINGSNLKQITAASNDNIETFPEWSPDGRFIATWCYKTFERSYYTAIAIVPSNPARPVELSDKAPVWPRDAKGYRISGGAMQLSWR